MKKLAVLLFILLLCIVGSASVAKSQALDRAHINFINPLDFGSTCSQTTLQAALTSVGSTKATVFLPKTDRAKVACTWTLTADLTTHANTTLWIPSGTVLIPNVNVTVTFNGPLHLDDPDSLQGSGAYIFNYPQTQDTASYVSSGCFPTVPFSALNFPPFACSGGITLNSSHLSITQEASTVGPLTYGAGTYWIMLDYSRTRGISGWTRQAGTHYLWQYSATQPTHISGTIIFAQVTVNAGAITAVVDVASYRIFTDQVAFTAPITTGSTSTWYFQPGAALVAGAPIMIGGSIINNSNQQIFLPGAQVTFADSFKQPVFVDWFGARNDGTADASSAINEAIASLPLHGHLKFGKGSYLVTASLTPFFNTTPTGVSSKSVSVSCEGKDSTQINFNPISPSTLFSWDGTNVPSRMASSGLENCSVYSGGTANKTILYVGNVDDFILTDVLINNTSSGVGDTSSTGLYIDKNPQVSVFTNLTIYNYPHPVVIGTAGAVQAFDHLTFNKLYVANVNQNPSVNSLIEVKDGSQLQAITFNETVGVGGNGLFKWVGTTTPTVDKSRNLVFSNGRFEDAGIPTAGYTFRIEPHVTKKLSNLRIVGMNLGTPGGGVNLHFRNIDSTTVQDVYSESNSEGTLYNWDGSNTNILMLNHTSTSLLSAEVVTGMKKIFGSGRDANSDNNAEPIKYYQTISAPHGPGTEYWQILNHRVYTANPSIANGAIFNIPPSNGGLAISQVFVGFTAGDDNPGGCHLMMYVATPGAGDTITQKISGTANCVGADPTPGLVGVYTAPGSDSINVKNNAAGASRGFSILVFYITLNPLP